MKITCDEIEEDDINAKFNENEFGGETIVIKFFDKGIEFEIILNKSNANRLMKQLKSEDKFTYI